MSGFRRVGTAYPAGMPAALICRSRRCLKIYDKATKVMIYNIVNYKKTMWSVKTFLMLTHRNVHLTKFTIPLSCITYSSAVQVPVTSHPAN